MHLITKWWLLLCFLEEFVKRILIKFWTTGRFILNQWDYEFKISIFHLVFSSDEYFGLVVFLRGWTLCLSGTRIKILPLDLLVASHRIPLKMKNSVYRLQISALVPEIFVFEKYIKYANEMPDDVIYSTQYYEVY